MKIYLAGTSVSNPNKEKVLQHLFAKGNKLHSYYHVINGFERKWYMVNKRNGVDLFLDSGAFSAWTKKIDIDVYKYIHFIERNKNKLTAYANLDVINNAENTYKNQKIMEAAKLSPIPVFHYSEDFNWLQKYLDEDYKYIALGGLVGISTLQIKKFLDTCFSKFLCDINGLPKVKVHAFGLTNFKLLFRYPWYSVDSTSWVVTGRLGSIFVPVFRNNTFCYTIQPHKIAVTTISPKLKEAGQHISNLSFGQKNILLQYIVQQGYKLGKSKFHFEEQKYQLQQCEKWVGGKPKNKDQKGLVETIVERGISNTYSLRDELNIKYYLELEKNFPKYPCKFKMKQTQKSLF